MTFKVGDKVIIKETRDEAVISEIDDGGYYIKMPESAESLGIYKEDEIEAAPSE